MGLKNRLFLIFIILMVLLSVSVVCASENTTVEQTDELEPLSAVETPTDQSPIDQSPEINELDDDISSEQGVATNGNANGQHQKNNVLGASNNGETPLRATVINLNGGTITDIIHNMANDTTIYLNGKTYTGTGTVNGKSFKNLAIYGGTEINPNQKARFTDTGRIITFNNCKLDNVAFESLDLNYREGNKLQTTSLYFNHSTINNLNVDKITFSYMLLRFDYCNVNHAVINDCLGTSHVFRTFCSRLYDVNCTNSETKFNNTDVDAGQFGTHRYSTLDHCNFINLTTHHHGGAFCVCDESNDFDAGKQATNILNSNFINITCWSNAVYYHGAWFDMSHSNFYGQKIENCSFINCAATAWGGALGVSHDGIIIHNCTFINNTAKQGAAIMLGGIELINAYNGNNTNGHNITISDCTFINNVASNEPIKYNSTTTYVPEGGGAIFIQGNDNKIINCIFIDNVANSGNGAAIYINGNNAEIHKTKFYNHTSVDGTVYIKGTNAKIVESVFGNNTGVNGAGVYIIGRYSVIENNDFINNTATNGAGAYVKGVAVNSVIRADAQINNNKFMDNAVTDKGGACYIEGSHTSFNSNNFTHNNAVLTYDRGLGGAIYVQGDYITTTDNLFDHNNATNGSAIYNDGRYFTLIGDTFTENQAKSYILITTAVPPESIHKTSDVNITVTHIAGDNVINAIYNKAKTQDAITLSNVHYTSSSLGATSTDDSEHPIVWSEGMIKDDSLLYQDDHEDNQLINIHIKNLDDPTVEFIITGLKTDIYGNVQVTLPKLSLKPGNYSVTSEHPEDWNYRYITGSTTFKINAIPVTPGKTVSNPTPNYGDIITYNLTVKNTADVVYSDNIYFRRYENV